MANAPAAVVIMLTIAFVSFLAHNPFACLSALAFAVFFAFLDDDDNDISGKGSK